MKYWKEGRNNCLFIMAQITCSFCGRTKKDVELMVSGINSHICNFCIDQAYQILMEEQKMKEEGKQPTFNLIKPEAMKQYLDQYVIAQDEAKKVISVAVDTAEAGHSQPVIGWMGVARSIQVMRAGEKDSSNR